MFRVHGEQTLQFGPLWILSALTGTAARFQPYELAAFWDAVVAVTLRTPEPARQLLVATARDRPGLLLDFELANEPVVSGLQHVIEALSDRDPEMAEDYKLALFRIGLGLARARGPYGRMITPQDEQLLLLIAELVELRSTPSTNADILV